MNPNYRRQSSAGQFAAVFRWVIVFAFFSTAGLSYVYLKNQMHLSGVQKRALENELADLISQNNVMAVQIVQLTSTTALQHRIDEGFLKLVPINNQAVVQVRTADSTRWTSDSSARPRGDFRAVSHGIGAHR